MFFCARRSDVWIIKRSELLANCGLHSLRERVHGKGKAHVEFVSELVLLGNNYEIALVIRLLLL